MRRNIFHNKINTAYGNRKNELSNDTFLRGNYVHSLYLAPTDVSEINCLLNEINVNKSSGPDGIRPTVIKSVTQYISPILVHIFNNSMQSGIIPESLKVAQIIPIYKANDPSEFTNYRPISILPILSKILEKVILKRLLDFLTKQDILNHSQFGFRKHHSITLIALNDLIDNISNSFDNRDYTIGVVSITRPHYWSSLYVSI